jgi:hypothetical protein
MAQENREAESEATKILSKLLASDAGGFAVFLPKLADRQSPHCFNCRQSNYRANGTRGINYGIRAYGACFREATAQFD